MPPERYVFMAQDNQIAAENTTGKRKNVLKRADNSID
jgi:hypothetical protein